PAEHGDILDADIGKSVRFLGLACRLIRLSGKSERDVEIEFTVLREREKLNEELFYRRERVVQPCNLL
ncbi:MAG TPA: polysaccharide biosynthesis protein, partial [Candidatus Acidoferrum sp.]|nr:polysaccharide biosynthesis protein [Candidatus Acidoferrum sp.]